MTIKKFVLPAFLLLCSLAVKAQEKDFGMWYGVETGHKLSKNWSVEGGVSMRTFNNSSMVDQYYAEVGLTRKIGKFADASAGYRLIRKNEVPAGYFNRHRWYIDLKTGFTVSRFKLNTRLRFQEQRKTYAENLKDRLPDDYFRVKEKIAYNWPSSPFNPFCSVEYYFPLRPGQSVINDKKRLSAGIDYHVRKKQHLTAEFIFDRETYPALSDRYIISLDYQIDF